MNKKIYKTKLYYELIKCFNYTSNPLSLNDIKNTLNITCNKTTLYRQLDQLVSDNYLSVFKMEKNQVWEKKPATDHSHLECIRCKKVICLEIDPSLMFNVINKEVPISNKINSIVSISVKCRCI